MKTPDLAGLKIGRLLVVKKAGKRGERRLWKCVCDCGREIEIVTSHLTGSSPTLSCGCITKERVAGDAHRAVLLANTITHGLSRTPTYTTWCDMIQRCTNPRRAKYPQDGGRGIKVCERLISFANFLSDMGERPVGTTIDRVNADGDYEPGNCRWATAREQARNKRKTRLNADAVVEIRNRRAAGETLAEIGQRFGVTHGHIANVLAGRTWKDVP